MAKRTTHTTRRLEKFEIEESLDGSIAIFEPRYFKPKPKEILKIASPVNGEQGTIMYQVEPIEFEVQTDCAGTIVCKYNPSTALNEIGEALLEILAHSEANIESAGKNRKLTPDEICNGMVELNRDEFRRLFFYAEDLIRNQIQPKIEVALKKFVLEIKAQTICAMNEQQKRGLGYDPNDTHKVAREAYTKETKLRMNSRKPGRGKFYFRDKAEFDSLLERAIRNAEVDSKQITLQDVASELTTVIPNYKQTALDEKTLRRWLKEYYPNERWVNIRNQFKK